MLKLKKLFAFFISALFLSLVSIYAANNDWEYEALKLKVDDLKAKDYKLGMSKITKIKLPRRKGVKKNINAERLLELSSKLMDQDISIPGVPLGSHPGWANPNTILKLKEIITNYPGSEAAVIAKLRLAIIIGHGWYGRNPNWARELYSEIEEDYPNTWYGIYAGFLKIASDIHQKSDRETIARAIKALLHYIPSIKNMKKEIDKRIADFENEIYQYRKREPQVTFVPGVYIALAGGYCLLEDMENAKKIYKHIVDKFPNTSSAKSARFTIEQLKLGNNPLVYHEKKKDNEKKKKQK